MTTEVFVSKTNNAFKISTKQNNNSLAIKENLSLNKNKVQVEEVSNNIKGVTVAKQTAIQVTSQVVPGNEQPNLDGGSF